VFIGQEMPKKILVMNEEHNTKTQWQKIQNLKNSNF